MYSTDPLSPDAHEGVRGGDKYEGQRCHVLLRVPVAGVWYVSHQVKDDQRKDRYQIPGAYQRQEQRWSKQQQHFVEALPGE